ncbi:MAG: hypothetical protein AMXMBFR56_29380 [Polyangiaceae bacterium]
MSKNRKALASDSGKRPARNADLHEDLRELEARLLDLAPVVAADRGGLAAQDYLEALVALGEAKQNAGMS